MKKNTILLTVLAIGGMVAVWWFMLRDKASAAGTDDLGTVLDNANATPGGSSLSGSGSTDLLGTLTGLVTALTGSGTSSSSPAASTTSLTSTNPWAKTPQGGSNLWTNLATGKQVTLSKGHNPNIVTTLTAGDYSALSQALSTNSSATPVVVSSRQVKVKVKPGYTPSGNPVPTIIPVPTAKNPNTNLLRN